MTGPEANSQAVRSANLFMDSLEASTKEYLKRMFPSEDDSHTMELIDLMTSKNPDEKIRAKVAVEGGFDPCAEKENNATLFKRHVEMISGVPEGMKNCWCFSIQTLKSWWC